MRKKLITLFSVCLLVLSMSACGDAKPEPSAKPKDATSPTKSDKPDEKPTTGKVDTIKIDNSEGTLIYTKHELIEDFDGNPAIRIYFDYTNKKDEASSAQMTFYPQTFQNGVECDMGFVMDENEADSNTAKDIQKDTTLNIAFVYTLQDDSNNVTLKVTDQSVDNLLNNIYQEQELALQ